MTTHDIQPTEAQPTGAQPAEVPPTGTQPAEVQPTQAEQAPPESEKLAPESDASGAHRETSSPAEGPIGSVASQPASDQTLFGDGEMTELRARWTEVQAAFVDDPRDCVHKADGLVSDVVDRLTAGFAQARSGLEEQWSRGEEASTEDLRVALQRYRDFFERLLAV